MGGHNSISRWIDSIQFLLRRRKFYLGNVSRRCKKGCGHKFRAINLLDQVSGLKGNVCGPCKMNLDTSEPPESDPIEVRNGGKGLLKCVYGGYRGCARCNEERPEKRMFTPRAIVALCEDCYDYKSSKVRPELQKKYFGMKNEGMVTGNEK